MGRQITVEILGDSSKFVQAVDKADTASKPLDNTWDKLQETADQLSASMDTLKRVQGLDGVSEAADAFGNLERVMLGVNDMTGVMADQFGINLGPMQEYGQAAADVAGGMEGIIGGGAALVTQFKTIAPSLGPAIAATWAHVSALIAQAAAFIVANAPILLLIAGIALLAAGVVLLVKNWDTIQPHIQPVIDFFEDKVIPVFKAIWDQGLRPVVDFVRANWPEVATLILLPFAPLIILATDAFGIRSALVGGFDAIVGKVEDAAGWIGHYLNVAGGYFEDFKNMAMAPINALMGVIDSLINKIKSIPSPGSIVGGITGGIGGLAGGVFNQVADGGGGGSSPGGMGNPSSPGYKDPRGWDLTADDILRMRAETGGFVGGARQVIQLVVDGAVLAQVVARENGRGY